MMRFALFQILFGLLWPFLAGAASDANRLTYLESNDPFYVGKDFPRLITPQWVGEPEVEAVIVLAIDDMGANVANYETYLRPLLQRLKRIDGHAPVSIFCNSINPDEPHLRKWLAEGVSLENHTLAHPCPILATDFASASNTFHGATTLMNRVLGNDPVAFRTPCCDSINSASPRLFAELFNGVAASNEFLSIDSSVMNIFSSADTSLPREMVLDPDGKEKFRKYLPFPSFTTTVENYPYPYVIGKLCWEFPGAVPTDWEAQNFHGKFNPKTVADWKTALDLTVLKQGVMTFVFHPHGWISAKQMVEFVDYAVETYGKKVKFLNFQEAEQRLRKKMLRNRPLRALNGQDNGVRLLDLNEDGFLDIISANEQDGRTLIWQPANRQWTETFFPMALVAPDEQGQRQETGVKFGVIRPGGRVSAIKIDESVARAWTFDGATWFDDKELLQGLVLDGEPVRTCEGNRTVGRRDNGARFRDIDLDGQCELILSNERQNAVFQWSQDENTWKLAPYRLPEGTAIVDAAGRDNGLRFVDLNGDRFADVIFSNPQRYSLYLFVPAENLGWSVGWTREVIAGARGTNSAEVIPMISRGGAHPNNGAWFHSGHLWVQNEQTAKLPDIVDRRSFDDLLGTGMGSAQSPEESLSSMRVRDGFKVELVASEPLTMDPVAFEWGADGRLWVVEMADYPNGIDGNGKAGGRVRFLQDTNRDGRYDVSTLFLNGLNFPSGIMPWRSGVLISAAPDILFAEDTNGDGRADVKRILFTGFAEGNQQHRFNGFEYGLDNWIYGANGDSGGTVRRDPAWKANAKYPPGPFDLRGMDFRFRPDDGAFEPIEGQTQFGRRRDDWGNWFGNNNGTWLWHYVLPERYLARNPKLAVPDTKRFLANGPDAGRAYSISPARQRMNAVGAAGHVSAANSPTPYRDELFGPEFARSVFVSDPSLNLIHREVLEPAGASFTSHRAKGEEQSEFLASSDPWFRPVQIKIGPDSALYFADMYRQTIEHPEWIPDDVRQRINLRAGEDKGRIYRVFPGGKKLRSIPDLASMNTTQLVAALDSGNGWQRDTAQRLLFQRPDRAAAAPLTVIAKKSGSPKARLQALWALDGINAVSAEAIIAALNDREPEVRMNAVRVSELFLRATNLPAQVEGAFLARVDDPDPRVRHQVALSLGEWKHPTAAVALVKLAQKDPADRDLQTAILSSSVLHLGEMLGTLLEQTNPPVALAESWLGLAAAMSDEKIFVKALNRLSEHTPDALGSWHAAAVAGFLDTLAQKKSTLAQFEKRSDAATRKMVRALELLLLKARQEADQAAKNPSKGTNVLPAIQLLARTPEHFADDVTRLARFLAAQNTGEIQRAALQRLSQLHGTVVAKALLARWTHLEPDFRAEVIALLLSRSEWTDALLKAFEDKQIPAAQVGAAHQQTLLRHADKQIRQRAGKLFDRDSDRARVIRNYESVGKLKGDANKGRLVFEKHCAVCHQGLKGKPGVGPDLITSSTKSLPALLEAILDPNRAVEPRYVNYNITTHDDRDLSGIIATETSRSLTLRSAANVEETILRSAIKEMKSSGLSLMPEGLEKMISAQEMADLIAFLQTSAPAR